jgi:integrase
VARLKKAHVKALLDVKRREGRARDSVRVIFATLRGVLNAALDDEVIALNPAGSLGRASRSRVRTRAAVRQDEVKAFTVAQLETFLATAEKHSPLFPLYMTAARAGLRLGELLGLQLDDLRLTDRQADISRSLGQESSVRNPQPSTPKSGVGRPIDLSLQLVAVHAKLIAGRKEEAMTNGWRPVPPWAFVTSHGTPYSQRNVLRDFKRILRLAKLPPHFSPHCLRHTFATHHLMNGASIYYVSQQLGHSSIKLTVDTYGKWLRMRDTAAADRLDAPVADATTA